MFDYAASLDFRFYRRWCGGGRRKPIIQANWRTDARRKYEWRTMASQSRAFEARSHPDSLLRVYGGESLSFFLRAASAGEGIMANGWSPPPFLYPSPRATDEFFFSIGEALFFLFFITRRREFASCDPHFDRMEKCYPITLSLTLFIHRYSINQSWKEISELIAAINPWRA